MSVFRDNSNERDLLIDRALGFRGSSSGQETDGFAPEDLHEDAESYDRAASALYLALLPTLLFPMPAASLRRLKERADSIRPLDL